MNNDKLDDFEKLFDKVINEIDEKQQHLEKLPEKLGATKQQLISSKPFVVRLYTDFGQDTQLKGIFSSGTYLFNSSISELSTNQPDIVSLENKINNIAGTIDTFLSSTDSTAYYYPEVLKEYCYEPNPYLIYQDENTLSNRLAKIDKPLSETHKGVWSIYYSSKPDKDRMALYQMRQVYDNFFRILSPDKEVRKSIYWHIKEGDKPNQVYREERIQYAAFTHVKDQERAKTLVASAEYIKDVYDLLNKAHDIKPITSEYAKRALDSMEKIIQQWLDSLGLQNEERLLR